MEPARSLLRKNPLPVDLPRLHLRDGRVSAIRATQRSPYPKPALGEIQTIAHGAAYSVKRRPAHIFLADPALEHEIFKQSSDAIIRQGSNDRSIHSETALQTASHVVFATALPRPKMAGRGYALVARIKAQHHFPQADQIPGTLRLRLDLLHRHDSSGPLHLR